MSTLTRYAFIDTSNGEITGIIDTPDGDAYIDGNINSQGYLTVAVPFDIAPNIAITNWYYVYTGDLANDYFAERPERPAEYYNWESHEWTLDSDAMFSELRAERTNRLKLSDWAVLPDSPLSTEQKATWETYRQALRDVPANNLSITHLDEVTWPIPPQ